MTINRRKGQSVAPAMETNGHDDLGVARGLLTGVLLALTLWLLLRSL
jgi:hypothetical protein